ncbi:toll-like receptor 2 type-2 isoform X2 [Liolophura sinensis]
MPTEKFTADLLGIDLSYNQIPLIEDYTFSMLSNLRTLDLSANLIVHIESKAFAGLENLVSLNLSQSIQNFTTDYLSVKLFEPLLSLEVIRIQRCKISKEWINQALCRLNNLTTLFIDFPQNFTFDLEFESVTRMRRISTQEAVRLTDVMARACEWSSIKNETFVAFRDIAVRELTLVRCEIENIESGAFDPLISLEVLDLSFNQNLGLRVAFQSLAGLPSNMSTINMAMVNSYMIGYKLGDRDFMYLRKICVRSVDLSQNYIYYDDDTSNPVKFRLDCLEKLNMSYHAINFWPSKLMSYLISSERLTQIDFYRIGYSSSKSSDDLVTSRDCSGPFILPPNLKWLSVSGCQQWFIPCSTVDFSPNLPSLQYLRLDYAVSDICAFPLVSGVPNLTHLDITGIKCLIMGDNIFPQSITTLDMSNCPYAQGALILSRPFDLLKNLREINLSGNGLMDLQIPIFKSPQELRTVILAYNGFQRLPGIVSHIPHLRKLDLTANAITHFQPKEISLLDSLMSREDEGHRFQIILGGNPLQCTCETVVFIRWLFWRESNVAGVDHYRCFLSNGTKVYLKDFRKQLTDFEVKCVSHTYLIISVVGILTLLVLVLLFVVVYRYRLNLRYWLYTKLMPPQDMFVDQEYIYDAFVAYTSDEYEWVVRQLRPKLELVDDPVTLCVHDRDFTPGKPIHENIVDKMKESRKILLIISPGFLESRYGPLEIEYAGMKCLEEGRDDAILCVLMEDIPVRLMPRALRNLWHKITFLKWSADPEAQVIFWRNLKAAVSPTPP